MGAVVREGMKSFDTTDVAISENKNQSPGFSTPLNASFAKQRFQPLLVALRFVGAWCPGGKGEALLNGSEWLVNLCFAALRSRICQWKPASWLNLINVRGWYQDLGPSGRRFVRPWEVPSAEKSIELLHASHQKALAYVVQEWVCLPRSGQQSLADMCLVPLLNPNMWKDFGGQFSG